VISTRSISVFFRANPRIISQGAVCTIECPVLGPEEVINATTATMSSEDPSYPAINCIDGDHTTECNSYDGEPYPWLAIELTEEAMVTAVNITLEIGHFAIDVEVRVLESLDLEGLSSDTRSTKGELLGFYPGPGSNGEVVQMTSAKGILGKFIFIQISLAYPSDFMAFYEVVTIGRKI